LLDRPFSRTVTSWSAAAAALVSFGVGLAHAQETPYVPEEWKYGRHQTGSTLQYCLDVRDPDLPVARKIGQAIAGALLLEPKPHELGQESIGDDLDNLYRVFLETCDVYLGFKLIPDAYPQWLGVTRPYYRTSYVTATAGTQWNALADMPRAQAIGATIGTSADIRLIQYLQSLPADSQWSRFPMGSDELALRALVPAKRSRRVRPAENHRVAASAGFRGRRRRHAALAGNLPAQQHRSGDRGPDGRRHHPVHSRQRKVPRDRGQMTAPGAAALRNGRNFVNKS
jgi:hypothetical protein